MLKKYFLTIFAYFIYLNIAFPQCTNFNADSIVKSIEGKNISYIEKADLYKKFAFNYRVSYPILSIQCLQNALTIYIKNNDDLNYSYLCGTIAEYYNQIGLYDLGVYYMMEAYQVFSKTANTDLAWILIDVGNIYFKAKDFEKAKTYYNKSFEIFKDKNFHLGKSVIYLNYGLIKEEQNESDSALFYYKNAFEERKFTYDTYLIAHIYHYIARVHLKLNNFTNARSILYKSNKLLFAHKIPIDIHKQQIYTNYILLAQSYEKQNDLVNASLFTDSALFYATINTDTANIQNGLIYLGELNLKMNKPLDAIYYFEKATLINDKDAFLETKSNLYLIISECYLQLNKYDKAQFFLLKHQRLHKEILAYNENNKQQSLVLALEAYMKNIEIEEFKEKEQINKQILLILMSCFVFAIVISSIFYFYKTRLWKSNKELINTAFDGIVLHQQGIIYDANESFIKFSGYTHKELKQKSIFDLLDFDIFDTVKKNISENRNAHYITKIKIKNGAFLDVEVESRPFVYRSKKMRLVTVKDISEQIKTNAQIHLFKTIIEQNYSTVVITDSKGNIEYVNPSFTQMTGYAFDEAIGKNPRILKSDLHDNNFYQNLWDNISTGKPWNGIFKNVDKSGHYFWEEATISPIKDNENNIIKFVAIKQDITKKMALENEIKLFGEKLKRIFETIDAYVFVVNLETEQIITSNIKTTQAFGNIENTDIKELLYGNNTEDQLLFPKEMLLLENAKPSHERKIIKSEVYLDNKKAWYELNMRTLNWVDGTKAILIVANDITENKNSIIQLNELNATKDKFFSIISHDLKNPFQGLLGFSEILLNDFDLNDTKSVKMMLSHINNISKTSFKLLENLLEWANLQKGLITIEMNNFNLKESVIQTIEIEQPFYSKKQININTLIPETLEVFSDLSVLTTVLRNLLSNAIKFTPLNGDIIISAVENGNEVIISVKDNGVGIPKEMISKLFKIETKYTVIGTEGEIGNGLGLILCKEFINKIGGKIYAESILNEGSTFYFTVEKAR